MMDVLLPMEMLLHIAECAPSIGTFVCMSMTCSSMAEICRGGRRRAKKMIESLADPLLFQFCDTERQDGLRTEFPELVKCAAQDLTCDGFCVMISFALSLTPDFNAMLDGLPFDVWALCWFFDRAIGAGFSMRDAKRAGLFEVGLARSVMSCNFICEQLKNHGKNEHIAYYHLAHSMFLLRDAEEDMDAWEMLGIYGDNFVSHSLYVSRAQAPEGLIRSMKRNDQQRDRVRRVIAEGGSICCFRMPRRDLYNNLRFKCCASTAEAAKVHCGRHDRMLDRKMSDPQFLKAVKAFEEIQRLDASLTDDDDRREMMLAIDKIWDSTSRHLDPKKIETVISLCRVYRVQNVVQVEEFIENCKENKHLPLVSTPLNVICFCDFGDIGSRLRCWQTRKEGFPFCSSHCRLAMNYITSPSSAHFTVERLMKQFCSYSAIPPDERRIIERRRKLSEFVDRSEPNFASINYEMKRRKRNRVYVLVVHVETTEDRQTVLGLQAALVGPTVKPRLVNRFVAPIDGFDGERKVVREWVDAYKDWENDVVTRDGSSMVCVSETPRLFRDLMRRHIQDPPMAVEPISLNDIYHGILIAADGAWFRRPRKNPQQTMYERVFDLYGIKELVSDQDPIVRIASRFQVVMGIRSGVYKKKRYN